MVKNEEFYIREGGSFFDIDKVLYGMADKAIFFYLYYPHRHDGAKRRLMTMGFKKEK